MRELVYFEVMKRGQTLHQISTTARVDQALRRQSVETRAVEFLLDNANHTPQRVLSKIEEVKWGVLPHPPYSPGSISLPLVSVDAASVSEKKDQGRRGIETLLKQLFQGTVQWVLWQGRSFLPDKFWEVPRSYLVSPAVGAEMASRNFRTGCGEPPNNPHDTSEQAPRNFWTTSAYCNLYSD